MQKNILTAAVLTFIAYVIYPAILVMIAAGTSGCATEEVVASPPTETVMVYGPEDCSNGQDDDGDGLVDCADSNCFSGGWCNSAGTWFGAQDVRSNGAFYPNDIRPEEPPATTRTDDSFVDALFGSWWFRIPLIITFLFLVGFACRKGYRLDVSEGERENLERRLECEKVSHSDTRRENRALYGRESDMRQLITTLNRARLDDLVEIDKLRDKIDELDSIRWDDSKEIFRLRDRTDELRAERDLACLNNRCLLRMLGVRID